MTTEIAIPSDVDGLVRLWLARKAPGTLKGYERDLMDFASWLGRQPGYDSASASPATALDMLFRLDEHEAMRVALAFEADLLNRRANVPDAERRGLAATTINRRMSALRSVVALAKTVGVCRYTLGVPSLRVSRAGELGRLDHEACRAIIGHLAGLVDAEQPATRELARRDLALVRLLWDSSLRRDEVFSLDYPTHVDLRRRILRLVDAKASQGQVLEVPVSDDTRHALSLWLAVRGREPGPLMFPLDRCSRAQLRRRLNIRGINKIIRRLALACELGDVRPHDFRRGSMTRLLDLTGGDIRLAMQQGRVSAEVAMRYDQRRSRAGGRLPNLLAQDSPTPSTESPDDE